MSRNKWKGRLRGAPDPVSLSSSSALDTSDDAARIQELIGADPLRILRTHWGLPPVADEFGQEAA